MKYIHLVGFILFGLLTIALPELGNARQIAVADYSDDYSTPAPAAGWSYLWNSGGAVGTPIHYTPLLFSAPTQIYTTTGAAIPTVAPGQFTLIGEHRAHPGPGLGPSTGDPQGFARYAIAAFTVSSTSAYVLVDTFAQLGNLQGAGNGFEIIVHVNDNPPLLHAVFGDDGPFDGTIQEFDLTLGQLSAGDTVYVAVGANGSDFFDEVSLDFTIASVSGVEDVTLDPTSTFLRADDSDAVTHPFVMDLAAAGLFPGDEVRITELGDFAFGPFNPDPDPIIGGEFDGQAFVLLDSGTSLVGVFSSGDVLLDSAQLHRVPGAISIGEIFVTRPNCGAEANETDIAEDFIVSPETIAIVPPGATHLFLGVHDCFWADNADPDNDYRVSIEKTSTPRLSFFVDGCDVVTEDGWFDQGDINEMSAYADGSDIYVNLVLCGESDDRVRYQVGFDTTGKVSDNAKCQKSADAVMSRKGNRDKGPGIIETRTSGSFYDSLLFTVSYAELGVSPGEPLALWARTSRDGLGDQVPNADAADSCTEPQFVTETIFIPHLPTDTME